jgi:hypothetical protein
LNEFLEFLEEQKKKTVLASWARRLCTVYAQGMKRRIREMEKCLDTVYEASKKNANDTKTAEKRVSRIEEKLESRAGKPLMRSYGKRRGKADTGYAWDVSARRQREECRKEK